MRRTASQLADLAAPALARLRAGLPLSPATCPPPCGGELVTGQCRVCGRRITVRLNARIHKPSRAGISQALETAFSAGLTPGF